MGIKTFVFSFSMGSLGCQWHVWSYFRTKARWVASLWRPWTSLEAGCLLAGREVLLPGTATRPEVRVKIFCDDPRMACQAQRSDLWGKGCLWRSFFLFLKKRFLWFFELVGFSFFFGFWLLKYKKTERFAFLTWSILVSRWVQSLFQ